jgi:hypothetical protein
MTAILERRESESLWGRFCNWIQKFSSAVKAKKDADLRENPNGEDDHSRGRVL